MCMPSLCEHKDIACEAADDGTAVAPNMATKHACASRRTADSSSALSATQAETRERAAAADADCWRSGT